MKKKIVRMRYNLEADYFNFEKHKMTLCYIQEFVFLTSLYRSGKDRFLRNHVGNKRIFP
jgi:hypothetical protein